jgi:hypothetical protein
MQDDSSCSAVLFDLIPDGESPENSAQFKPSSPNSKKRHCHDKIPEPYYVKLIKMPRRKTFYNRLFRPMVRLPGCCGAINLTRLTGSRRWPQIRFPEPAPGAISNLLNRPVWKRLYGIEFDAVRAAFISLAGMIMGASLVEGRFGNGHPSMTTMFRIIRN